MGVQASLVGVYTTYPASNTLSANHSSAILRTNRDGRVQNLLRYVANRHINTIAIFRHRHRTLKPSTIRITLVTSNSIMRTILFNRLRTRTHLRHITTHSHIRNTRTPNTTVTHRQRTGPSRPNRVLQQIIARFNTRLTRLRQVNRRFPTFTSTLSQRFTFSR